MIKDIENRNEGVKINDKEIAVLKEYFPSCFQKDGSFDVAKLQVQLKDKVDIIHEGYELNFLGKSYAKLLASIDTTTIIKPDAEHNDKPENVNSENIYISGDNLDGLKHLLKSYARQVKCIYIDPPYNTGGDGFVYNDKFNFTIEELQRKLSIDETHAQRIIDLTKRKSASHSAWLMFMYSRLQLAKDLLTNDGVIFISIDDNELSNLRLICDDIFGEENFEGHIHWRRRHNQPNDVTKMIGLVAEHIISYSRNKEEFKKNGVGKIDITGNFSNPDNDSRGEWASKPWKVGSDQSGSRYEIINPNNGAKYNEEWMGDESTYKKLFADNRIVFPKKGEGLPRKKYFRFEREKEGQCATNWWTHEQFGHNQGANDEMTNLFDGIKNVFSNPKPKELIRGLIQISNSKGSDIILDFFSGSATTSQSVMEMNADDKGNRKIISIQLPETLDTDNTEQKIPYDFLKSNNRPTTLDYIGIERIIRAAKKIKEETKADIDYGFKHYELKEVSENTLDKCETFDKAAMIADRTILDDFGTASVLTTWLVSDGYGFNAKAEAIDLKGYTAYYCKKHLYLINPNLTQDAVAKLYEKYDSIADFNPENIVLFGYSFNEWSVTDMLEKNLRVLNESEKNLKINIDVRY